jgi:hypothetical protein
MLTIREQIQQLIKAELAKILTANGYTTNIGQRVVRGRYDLVPPELPATLMLANQDTADSGYGHDVHEMPLTVAGFSTFATSQSDTSDRVARLAEQILGDIQVCLLSPRMYLAFTTGTREPAVGTVITGSSSGATGILESITLSSGSWAGGDAAGTLLLRMPWQDYEAETLLNSGGETLATTTGVITEYTMFSDLLNSVEYQRGGIDPLPDVGDDILKVSVSFSIFYATLAGNPYKQS